MIKHDKLVRDKIPEIIADSGKKAIFRIADRDEYLEYLEKKLDEEVAEFHESKSFEELVDIYTVVLALAEAQGFGSTVLNYDFGRKVKKRGDFSRRIILIESEE